MTTAAGAAAGGGVGSGVGSGGVGGRPPKPQEPAGISYAVKMLSYASWLHITVWPVPAKVTLSHSMSSTRRSPVLSVPMNSDMVTKSLVDCQIVEQPFVAR